jgi:hypothetical protein
VFLSRQCQSSTYISSQEDKIVATSIFRVNLWILRTMRDWRHGLLCHWNGNRGWIALCQKPALFSPVNKVARSIRALSTPWIQLTKSLVRARLDAIPISKGASPQQQLLMRNRCELPAASKVSFGEVSLLDRDERECLDLFLESCSRMCYEYRGIKWCDFSVCAL